MESKKRSATKAVAITAIVTLAAATAGFYGLYKAVLVTPADHDHTAATETMTEEEAQLYSCGMHPWIIAEEPGACPICGMDLTPIRDQAGPSAATTGERQIVYWRAPMDPTEIYHEPGQSKMGMDLVPVYDDELVGGVDVSIDPVTQQNMAVRTAPVRTAALIRTIRTYGNVAYDETRTAHVHPRFGGWVERMYVDYTGRRVKKGEPLFDIYSPELVSAQEEYLAARRNLSGKGDSTLLASARKRLAYFGVHEREIVKLEKRGEATRTLTIRSPIAGFVTAKKVSEGHFVKKGAPVYEVADLSKIWLEAAIYEHDLPWVKEGQKALVRMSYQPGVTLEGRVTYIDPYLNVKTRDVVARIEFDNASLNLKPGMYADVSIEADEGARGLVIPDEAVIRGGSRNVVFITRGDGKFSPRDVTLGVSLDDGTVHVLTGLAPGDEVVVSGQFLLDSESKLKEAIQKMLEAKSGSGQTGDKEEDFFGDMADGAGANGASAKAKGDDSFFDDLEVDKAGEKKSDD